MLIAGAQPSLLGPSWNQCKVESRPAPAQACVAKSMAWPCPSGLLFQRSFWNHLLLVAPSSHFGLLGILLPGLSPFSRLLRHYPMGSSCLSPTGHCPIRHCFCLLLGDLHAWSTSWQPIGILHLCPSHTRASSSQSPSGIYSRLTTITATPWMNLGHALLAGCPTKRTLPVCDEL